LCRLGTGKKRNHPPPERSVDDSQQEAKIARSFNPKMVAEDARNTKVKKVLFIGNMHRVCRSQQAV
jgi:hypothetical protein